MTNSTVSPMVNATTTAVVPLPGPDNEAALSNTDIAIISLGCLFFLCALAILVFLVSFNKLKFPLLKFLKKTPESERDIEAVQSHDNEALEAVEVPAPSQTKSVFTFEGEQGDMNTKRSVGAFQKYYRSILRSPNELAKEFKHLRDWSSRRNKRIKSIGQSVENLWKNRDPKAIPDNRYLVTLIDDENPYALGGYINASYVDGHNRSKEYITTQLPMDSTQDEFWQMIYQEHVHQVICLCDFVDGQEDFTPFWKTSGPSANFNKVRVRMYEETRGEIMTTYKIKIQDVEGNDYVLDCVLIEFNFKEQINNIENILMLMEKFRNKRSELQKRLVPSVVMCSNGIEDSGAFVSMSISMDQSEADHVVNIPGVVRGIRKFRPNFVSQAQYRLCYDVMARFLDRRGHSNTSQQG